MSVLSTSHSTQRGRLWRCRTRGCNEVRMSFAESDGPPFNCIACGTRNWEAWDGRRPKRVGRRAAAAACCLASLASSISGMLIAHRWLTLGLGWQGDVPVPWLLALIAYCAAAASACFAAWSWRYANRRRG